VSSFFSVLGNFRPMISKLLSMADCILCNTQPIICKETDAYIINSPVPKTNHYLRINDISSCQIDIKDLKTVTLLTPGARSRLTITEYIEIINHRSVWEKFLQSSANHCIVFDGLKDAEDRQLSIIIENKVLPKDWDILMIGKTQYVLNKRATKILFTSSRQLNSSVSDYIKSFRVLKIANL